MVNSVSVLVLVLVQFKICRNIKMSSAKNQAPIMPIDISEICDKELLKNIDALLIDCDGVIWNGTKVVPNAPETINKLKDAGKKVYFVTNNSTKSRSEYAQKCKKMGFNVSEDDIMCTAYIAATHLKRHLRVKKVYMIGSNGIAQELDRQDIAHSPVGPDPVVPGQTFDDWGNVSLEKDVEAVVVGFDEHISYMKILKAASYLKNPNCHFIATNADEVFPLAWSDAVIPGTGSILSAVVTAAGREPTILGKPYTGALDLIREDAHVDPSKAIMIGDRLNTDILFGKNCGFTTLAVGTGITSKQEIANTIDQNLIPDYYADSISLLLNLL